MGSGEVTIVPEDDGALTMVPVVVPLLQVEHDELAEDGGVRFQGIENLGVERADDDVLHG